MKKRETHADDTSQQPRQTTTPSAPENSAIENEDRAKARQTLTEGQRDSTKPSDGAKK